MREAAFVKQNKEKWIGFEKALNNNVTLNPDDLASYYIQLTNDLSFALKRIILRVRPYYT
jgi:hypothetical protein